MAAVDTLRFGKYEILEELGRGGMGIVYKARDPVIGRLVALKTLTSSLAADPDMLKRFYREAQAAGRLQHPNIITIFDMGDAEGRPFIAMSFLEGESLEKMIARREPLSLAQKLGIILQFCRGLDFAHKHDVVHRDVKPGNIFVKTDGTVTVLDFGIVHIAATTMTQSGMVIGTPQYMSPEQISGQHIDHRSDIFSVGTVAYEFLSYVRPFDGPNLPSVVFKIKFDKPAPLSELVPDIPRALEQAVMRCLEQRPEDRFQSLEDLVLELEPLELSLRRQMVGELVGQGQVLYQQGEYIKAKEKLRSVLNLDSANDLAKNLMAKVNTELRRLEVASKIERLMEEGSTLLARGQSTEAVRVLEDAKKLDSQHAQVNTLLAEARKRIEREKMLRASISALQTALNTGNLTVAEAELGKIRELDAEHPEVRNFQERIKQARAHERRLRIQQALLFPRHLLIQERFTEALEQLEELNKEFPSEAEILELLATGRHKLQEQTRRKEAEDQLKAIARLVAEQQFDEAEESLNRLRSEPDRTPELTELYESARRQLEDARREQQLDRELAIIQELIRVENYDSAVSRAGALQVQFPDSAEARHLFDFALGLKQTVEQQKEIAAICRAIQSLLDSGRNTAAERETIAALRRFPDNPALSNLLLTARAAQVQEAAKLEQEKIKQQVDAEIEQVNELLQTRDYAAALAGAERLQKKYPGRKEIQRLAEMVRTSARADERRKVQARCQTIQSLLDTGEFDRAVQEADDGLHQFPGNVDLAAIRSLARRRQAERDIQRQKEQAEAEARKSAEAQLPVPVNPTLAGPQLEDQLRTAILQIEQREFGQATQLLRALESQHPEDSRIREFLHAAEAGEAATASATRVFLPDQATDQQRVDETPSPAGADLAGPSGPFGGEPEPILPSPEPTPVTLRTSTPEPRPKVEPPPIPIWKRPAVIGAAAAAIVLVAIVVWKLIKPPPPPPKPEATAEQRQLLSEAQNLEQQHQLEGALSDWQTLAGESGPLQGEARQGVSRVQDEQAKARNAFDAGRRAEDAKKYDEAEKDYRTAENIDAGLRVRADQRIGGLAVVRSGGNEEQVEQDAYNKGVRFFGAQKYKEADDEFQTVVEMNLPGSKRMALAQGYLARLKEILPDQQKMEVAKKDFDAEDKSNPQYDKVKAELQNLVDHHSVFAPEAQEYLSRISAIEDNAKRAAQNAALKQVTDAVIGKINARRYGDALAALPDVINAGGDNQTVQDLRNKIAGAYTSELSADKVDAANNPAEANLQLVLGKVEDLAQRAGDSMNASALAYEGVLKKQIAGVPPRPSGPAGGTEAPSTTTAVVLKPTIKVQHESLAVWASLPPPSVDARYVDGGVDEARDLTLPDGINALAKPQNHVDLICAVGSNGSVENCTPMQDSALARAIAAYGKNWKFKSPRGTLYLNQGKKNDRPVAANVTLTVDY